MAKKVLPGHIARLKADIDDALSYKLEEIRENHLDTERALAEVKAQLKQADDGETKLITSQRATLVKRRETFEKGIAKRDAELAAAEATAAKERQSVDDVADELLAMFVDPEQRKRYFAIVEREELEENEFNLNIPRYVDTFEPEEEIDLKEAIDAFSMATQFEEKQDQALLGFIARLKGVL